jgi:hypothetical protein
MTSSRPPELDTRRKQRWKKPRPLTNKRYWIHPRFGVGVYVEESRALPARIFIMRHTDGALSVATSNNSIRVTAIDNHAQDCEPEIYSIAVKSNCTAVPDEDGEPVVWPNPPKLTSFSPVQPNAGHNHKR